MFVPLSQIVVFQFSLLWLMFWTTRGGRLNPFHTWVLLKKEIKVDKSFLQMYQAPGLLLTPVSGTSLWCGTLQLWFWVSKMLGGKRQIVQGLGPPPLSPFPHILWVLVQLFFVQEQPGMLLSLLPWSCSVSLVQLLSAHNQQLWGETLSSALTALFSCFGVEFCRTICQNNFLMCFYCRSAPFTGVW